MKKLPIPFLNECFDVDLDAGTLTWKVRPVSHFKGGKRLTAAGAAAKWNSRYAGKIAASAQSQGYLSVAIERSHYLVHRVIWAMANSAWPEDQIDHKNGVRTDNRLVNLRAVSQTENCRNLTARRGGTSRFAGVSWSNRTRKWQAQIMIDGKQKHLGRFANEEDAAAAYRAAARAHGFTERHLQPAGGAK